MSVTTTYVEMRSHTLRAIAPPRDGLLVLHVRHPTLSYYRYLYDAVGRDWKWTSRKKLDDAALAAIIHDPRDEIHVLHVDGVPAGFVEMDCRVEGEIEIAQFGLVPEFIGQGLGRYFLQWAVDRAWSYGPRRLWLHTCTDDHPGALPNYLQAGFVVFRQETR